MEIASFTKLTLIKLILFYKIFSLISIHLMFIGWIGTFTGAVYCGCMPGV